MNTIPTLGYWPISYGVRPLEPAGNRAQAGRYLRPVGTPVFGRRRSRRFATRKVKYLPPAMNGSRVIVRGVAHEQQAEEQQGEAHHHCVERGQETLVLGRKLSIHMPPKPGNNAKATRP